jgi:hypothetical protein
LKHERLSDISAEREAEQVHLGQTERADEVGGVPCHGVDRVRCFTARAGNARVIEEYHGPIGREPIGDGRVPVIQPTPEMLHEDEGRARFGSESSVSKANPVGLNELSWCCHMGVGHHGRHSPDELREGKVAEVNLALPRIE